MENEATASAEGSRLETNCTKRSLEDGRTRLSFQHVQDHTNLTQFDETCITMKKQAILCTKQLVKYSTATFRDRFST